MSEEQKQKVTEIMFLIFDRLEIPHMGEDGNIIHVLKVEIVYEILMLSMKYSPILSKNDVLEVIRATCDGCELLGESK